MKAVFQATVVTDSGDIIPNAEITVTNAGTSDLSTIYSDSAGSTPLTNPFNATSEGFARFYAASGRYDVAVNDVVVFEDVALFSPSEPGPIGSETRDNGAFTALSSTHRMRLDYTVGADGSGLSGTDMADIKGSAIVAGDLVQTDHYDSTLTIGSNALVRFTGVTTAGNAGKTPAEAGDGYFYDAVGRQFSQVNTYPVASFGSTAPAIAAAVVDGGEITFPIGDTQENSLILADSSNNAQKLSFKGWDRFKSILSTTLDGVLIYIREGFTFRDLFIAQDGTAGTGRPISTSNSNQTAWTSFLRMRISNFRFGIWLRYSLWTSFRDLRLTDNTCGIRLARADYDAGNDNDPAPGGWNGNPGWFHNQNTFDNVLADGGEVGLWVTGMGNTYMNITTQGQDTDGSANDVLPGSQQGTGMYLDSEGDGTKAFQDVVINHYVEDTKIGAYYKDKRYVLVNGMFMQGGPTGDRAEAFVIADGSNVELNAVTGQGFFDAKVKAINGAVVWVNSFQGAITATTEWDADATSKIKMRGLVDKDKYEYYINKPNGTAELDFVLPQSVPNFSVAKLYLNGVRDGSSARAGEMTIWNYTGSLATQTLWVTGAGSPPTNVSVAVSNAGVITITLTDSLDVRLYVVLEIIGGHMVSGNATTITGT